MQNSWSGIKNRLLKTANDGIKTTTYGRPTLFSIGRSGESFDFTPSLAVFNNLVFADTPKLHEVDCLITAEAVMRQF
jgi:hypothetical protein